jgi:hypothetical protein
MSTKQDQKRWRKSFNEECLERDHHKCKFCERTDDLDVHHITDRHEIINGGYTKSNGITLCDEHHILCEEFHSTGSCLFKYHPDQLYKMIGSSYQKAINDSLNLK